jgi:hypothetical protein
MQIRIFSIFSVILISYAANFAQTISIDLDSSSGIQSTFTSKDTVLTIGVAIRLTGINQISSYQFKVAFDTSRFSFVGTQQDFGITGEKNILTKNSGSIIGIAQLQLNPPASDTVEFSYSITGSNISTLVSGDGLAGVLYLKSKIHLGDSSAISVSNGMLADFDLNQTPISAYNKGMYSVLPVTWNIIERKPDFITNPEQLSSVTLSIQNNVIQFNLPNSIVSKNKMLSVTFYTLNGKYLTGYKMISNNNNIYTTSENNNSVFNQSGRYLCCLKTNSRNYSQIVTIR